MRNERNRESRTARVAFALILAAVGLGLAACSKSAPTENAKRYHMAGKVLSIDLDHNTMSVDMQAIPGYMDAMTMSFNVPDAHNLATVQVGDEIAADIVVKEDSTYVENIIVTKRPAPGSQTPPSSQHEPQPGERVPDFAMIDQDGKRIHLSSYRGVVLLVTFIYTRCPFPDYCPLVSKNFAKVYAATREDPELRGRVRLLSVSFDPKHDTPAVLKQYGKSFRLTTGGDPFDRWEFAAVPARELPKVADFFGFFFNESGGQITHSMSTIVISPNGTVYKWYSDNAWGPDDLFDDVSAVLHRGETDGAATEQARADSAKGVVTTRAN